MINESLLRNSSAVHERDLRRQIDRSVSRALVDREYARQLLKDPTIVGGERGCALQHRRMLRSIRARSLDDFARQARALFWIGEPESAHAQDGLALAATAH